jgi:hypothetical protein
MNPRANQGTCRASSFINAELARPPSSSVVVNTKVRISEPVSSQLFSQQRSATRSFIVDEKIKLLKYAFYFCFFFALQAKAQLAVTISSPKVAGQKAIVQLAMTNELTNDIKSARAVCLLLDDQGKMVGQSTKWIIGQNKTTLAPKGQAKFDFVITTPRPLVSSNLTAKVIFSRLILGGGKAIDPRQEVEIIAATEDEKSKSH